MQPPYYVLLDANVWVAERLLQSSIGSALLYAISEADTHIVLPEVVELEVNGVLAAAAESAVGNIERDAALLRQLSGQRLSYAAPTPLAVSNGIAERWKQLEGTLRRVPFRHKHAKAALNRVLAKLPPSGPNNEQFRDSCIWEVVREVAKERSVNLVTGDVMFYEGRDRAAGLAAALRKETSEAGCIVSIYPTVRELLVTLKPPATLDQEAVSSAIVEAVTPSASEIATKSKRFQLGKLIRTQINGYATPRPSVIAVSFEVSFELEYIEQGVEGENASQTVVGICAYNPKRREVFEIEVREWTQRLGPGRVHGFSDPLRAERDFSPKNVRLIS